MLAQRTIEAIWLIQKTLHNSITKNGPDLFLIGKVRSSQIGRGHLVGHPRSSKRTKIPKQGVDAVVLGKRYGLRTRDASGGVEHNASRDRPLHEPKHLSELVDGAHVIVPKATRLGMGVSIMLWTARTASDPIESLRTACSTIPIHSAATCFSIVSASMVAAR